MVLRLDIRTVGDMGELPDSLPVFLLPDVPLNLETLRSSSRCRPRWRWWACWSR
jgi:hypothetical protein